VTRVLSSAFDLPDHLAAKDDPALIGRDEEHFAAIGQCLEESVADLSSRLDTERRSPGGTGQEALERDLEVHRLTGRLRTLRRYGLDLCLGRMVSENDAEPVYIGRLGLTDRGSRQLLVDWRSAVAEPFFGATHANPMGLVSRRRYRWAGGRVNDYWDEVFTPDGLEGHAALDDQSVFLASLGAGRSGRMRDVLGTIQADQDAIIRAGSRGTLVVDGGPGTGKTVVALHRTAYLLYSDPRLGHRRGGILFVGPHRPYLNYVADVLPSLGEEGVQTCTLKDLVPEGAVASVESDPDVARLKGSAEMVTAIEPAVRLYEDPPTEGMVLETDWADVWLDADDWAEAFATPDPGTPHNEAREEIWESLLAILVDQQDDDVPADQLRRSLQQNEELVTAFNRAWPVLEATDIVGDLWSVPAYLRMCAPWLGPDQVQTLQRKDVQAWTLSDVPLLDAARQRLGDPEASRRKRRRDATLAAERERMDRVIDHLIATDDSEMQVMSMLRGDDLRASLVDDGALPAVDPDELAGPFAHIVVDEAQELTDAEWQMLLLRSPTRSFTIVGDRAQARHEFAESWVERLERVGLDDVKVASLTVNYRTPEEIMTEAEPVIRAVRPDANVPISIRTTGIPVRHGLGADRDAILGSWLGANHEGIACVVGDPSFQETYRVRSLTPELCKGLEFDLVVLVEPEAFGQGIEGAVDRYVAMTRATQQLVLLTPPAREADVPTSAYRKRHRRRITTWSQSDKAPSAMRREADLRQQSPISATALAADGRQGAPGPEKVRDVVEGSGHDSVVSPFAALLTGEDAGVDQDLQVVGDGRLGQANGIDEVADAGLLVLVGGDEGYQPQAGGVGDGL
jgi:DNA helicase IV